MTTMQDSDVHSSSMTALELISNAIPLLQEQERQHQTREHHEVVDDGSGEHPEHQQQHLHSQHYHAHEHDQERYHRMLEAGDGGDGVEDLLNHPQVHDRILQEEHMLQQHNQLHPQQLEQHDQSGYPLHDGVDVSEDQQEHLHHHHHHHTNNGHHQDHAEVDEQGVSRDERTLADIALSSHHDLDPHSQQAHGHVHHHQAHNHHHQHHPDLEASLEMLGTDPNAMSDAYQLNLRDPQRIVGLPEDIPLPLPLQLDPDADSMTMTVEDQHQQAGPSSNHGQGLAINNHHTPIFMPAPMGLQALGEFEPMEFETFDELYEFVAAKARENGFSVSIYNPTRSKKGVLRAANLRCSKSGKHRETRTSETRRRKAHTSKTDCPFNLYAHRTDPISNKFTFSLRSGVHNHLPDYSKSGKPIRKKIRSGPAVAVVRQGGTAGAAGSGGGVDVEVGGEAVPRKKPTGKGKGKGKAKMMDEDAALLAGLQMQEAGSSSHGHGMELDPNVHDHDHDHDPSGLGGMMGVGGVDNEDAFGALDSTTLAEMGRGMQEVLHGHGNGDERDRLDEQGEEQEGYNHYSQHHLQQHQHQHQQDGRQTPSSHDQQQYSSHSHSHSHQHPSYADPGLDTDPNNLDPVFQTTTSSLSSASVAGTGFGVHRGNGGTENVSDLRTRRGVEGDDQTRHHDPHSYDEHQDQELRDPHAHEHHDPDDHAEVEHHQPEEVGEEGGEQMEMSLNGAMDAAAAAAVVGMGVGVEGEMMDIGMGMDMGYMGDVQEQGDATGAGDNNEGGDRTVEGGEEIEAYDGTGMEQPSAEQQEEDKIEGWS